MFLADRANNHLWQYVHGAGDALTKGAGDVVELGAAGIARRDITVNVIEQISWVPVVPLAIERRAVVTLVVLTLYDCTHPWAVGIGRD